MQLGFDLGGFFLTIVGLWVYQICAYVLATYAQTHAVLTDCLVRAFFIIIHVILLLIFEDKIHLFQ